MALYWLANWPQRYHLKPDDHRSLDRLEPRTPLYLEVGLVAVQALLTGAIAYLTRTASGLEMPSSWMLGYDTNRQAQLCSWQMVRHDSVESSQRDDKYPFKLWIYFLSLHIPIFSLSLALQLSLPYSCTLFARTRCRGLLGSREIKIGSVAE
jgi:hypothetical protein